MFEYNNKTLVLQKDNDQKLWEFANYCDRTPYKKIFLYYLLDDCSIRFCLCITYFNIKKGTQTNIHNVILMFFFYVKSWKLKRLLSLTSHSIEQNINSNIQSLVKLELIFNEESKGLANDAKICW